MNPSRVLIIEDEPELARLYATALDAAGFPSCVESTAEGMFRRLNETGGFDYVLLDLNLPGMDGIEALRQLSRTHLRPPQLVLVSGHGQRIVESAREIAAGLGIPILGALAKPVRIAQLVALIRQGADGVADAAAHADASSAICRTPEKALRDGHIVPHFQPLVNLASGRWVGIEALARWQHPELGILGPEAFVPQLENSGHCMSLSLHLLELAAYTAHQARETSGFSGAVSINLAPSALDDLTIPDQLLTRLAGLSWPAHRVHAEILESSIASDHDGFRDILTRMALRGFEIVLDDFGTGFTSLEMLHKLPISGVKIDKSYIMSAFSCESSRLIAESAVSLCRKLGLRVVAEGIESASHYQWLRELGCHCGQGFFIAKPMPAGQLAAWHQQWREQHAQLTVRESAALPAMAYSESLA